MLATLSFHRGNKDQAEKLCQKIKELGGVENHSMLLCTDEHGLTDRMEELLAGVFGRVNVFVAHEKEVGWPMRENALLANVGRQIHYSIKEAWLRMEPDSVPLCSSWLDKIESAYRDCGQPILLGISNNQNRLCSCVVFPANPVDLSLKLFLPVGQPWFVSAKQDLEARSARTEIMSEDPSHNPVVHVRHDGSRPQGMRGQTCIVQLGRMGDILNILPLVKHISDTEGRPAIMVHKDYADIVSDLAYCDSEVWDKGEWSDLSMAVNDAKDKYRSVIVPQIHGDRWQTERKCSSFCIESWRHAGHEELFGTLPLVLNRDRRRELEVVDMFIGQDNRPVVLVNSRGTSSPFPHADELLKCFDGNSFNVIDLANIRVRRFQELLGLYDKAVCLITIDTATLHLAEASRVPVIALLAAGPTPWHRSTLKGNVMAWIEYGEFQIRKQEITDTVERLKRRDYRAIYHIFHEWPDAGENNNRRNQLARKTAKDGNQPANWLLRPVNPKHRTSASIGCVRSLPFVRDIIESGIPPEATDLDWIVLTNGDTCVRKNVGHELLMSDEVALYGHRYDFQNLVRPLDRNEITTGKWYPGKDFFAFTLRWWKEHKEEFPDMILGGEAWDKVLARLVLDTGGGEIFAAVYHETHFTPWINDRAEDISNRWNRILAKEWLSSRGHPLEELAQFNDDPVTAIKKSDRIPNSIPVPC